MLEDGAWTPSERGTAQGGSISPLTANLYLHYVFDLWAQRWRKRVAQGEMIIVRYLDDFIVGFQERDGCAAIPGRRASAAGAIWAAAHPDKTRLLEFGRYAAQNRRGRGEGKPETFQLFWDLPQLWARPEGDGSRCSRQHDR